MRVFVVVRDNFGKKSVVDVYRTRRFAETLIDGLKEKQKHDEKKGGYTSMVNWEIVEKSLKG